MNEVTFRRNGVSFVCRRGFWNDDGLTNKPSFSLPKLARNRLEKMRPDFLALKLHSVARTAAFHAKQLAQDDEAGEAPAETSEGIANTAEPKSPEELPDLNKLTEIGINLLTATGIIILGWLASRWTARVVHKNLVARGFDAAIVRFGASMIRFLIMVVAIMAALDRVGIDTTSVVALLGAAGLAVGLALQGSLSNFASGVMLLLTRPINLDDWVIIDDQSGQVIDIGLFTTSILTTTGETVILPNAAVTDGTIINQSKSGKLRGQVDVCVAYGTDLAKVSRVIIDAVSAIDTVLDEPAVVVDVAGFSEHALNLEVEPWCVADHWEDMHDAAYEAVYLALEEAGIEAPRQRLELVKS